MFGRDVVHTRQFSLAVYTQNEATTSCQHATYINTYKHFNNHLPSYRNQPNTASDILDITRAYFIKPYTPFLMRHCSDAVHTVILLLGKRFYVTFALWHEPSICRL